MKNKTHILITVTMISILMFSGCSTTDGITNDPYTNRSINYGTAGAVTGAVIGNQIDGDRSDNRLIGAASGALLGAVLANSQNKQEQTQRVYEAEIRNIHIGNNTSDAEILKKRHEVEQMEEELKRREAAKREAIRKARELQRLENRKRVLQGQL